MIKVSFPIDSCQSNSLQSAFELDINFERWSVLQDALTSTHTLEGFFDDEPSAHEAIAVIRAHFDFLPEPDSIEPINASDWENAYKEYLKPWSCPPLHWVPVWEKDTYHLPAGHSALYLDAGMAFGTGAHETTQLCAQRLVELKASGANVASMQVIDAGCGSGILALSAKLLGYGPTEAFDIDPEVLAVCEENAQQNDLEGQVQFSIAALDQGLAGKQVDVLLANILPAVLCPNAERLLQSVAPGGILVLSGILATELNSVLSAFEPLAKEHWGTFDVHSRQLGEWTDCLFKRPA